MMKTTIQILILTLALVATQVEARSNRMSQVPNARSFGCNVCHTTGGGTPRNSFGLTVEGLFLLQGSVQWGTELANIDSDGDGFTNGQELGDPEGTGTAVDGAETSHPGDPSSYPQTLEPTGDRLLVEFAGMTPHVGQALNLRVVDKRSGREVTRALVHSIPEADFSVSMGGVSEGRDYALEFYADHDGNGAYDRPPTDHAWRLSADDVGDDTTIQFAHNTSFTDIDWTYLLTVNLKDMTPHLGQLFELRVVDETRRREVGRVRLGTIAQADFSVSVPGLRPGRDYRADFYADLNGNLRYDDPPTDHAWRESFTGTGDETLGFEHNVGFTAIAYPEYPDVPGAPARPRHRALVSATVTQDGLPAAGVDVAFARSISGERAEYRWKDTTGSDGRVDVEIRVDPARFLRKGASGYYLVRAVEPQSGEAIGEWGSVPLSGGKETELVLAVGERARVEGRSDLASTSSVALSNAPNPFNPSTQIVYNLPEAGEVSLVIYSLLGQEVRTLVHKSQGAGTHRVTWDGTDDGGRSVSSGVYLYRLVTDRGTPETRQMVLLK